jgi:hypothetical protein
MTVIASVVISCEKPSLENAKMRFSEALFIVVSAYVSHIALVIGDPTVLSPFCMKPCIALDTFLPCVRSTHAASTLRSRLTVVINAVEAYVVR